MRHDDKTTGSPRLLVSGRVPNSSGSARSHPVSTLAITPSLNIVAIGYADGSVQILRQLDQYIQSNSTGGPASLPKPKLVHSSPSNPVTGLGFRLPSASANLSNTITGSLAPLAVNDVASATDGNFVLFIVTTHQVLTYKATPTGRAAPGQSAMAAVMDDRGAALGCSSMLGTGDLILAKDEAIFVYGPEGRGHSYFYEGKLWHTPPLVRSSKLAIRVQICDRIVPWLHRYDFSAFHAIRFFAVGYCTQLCAGSTHQRCLHPFV